MRKLSDRERLESIFLACSQSEAAHLLDVAGVIVRSRFPGTQPVKRGRKSKARDARQAFDQQTAAELAK